jgi:D-glycero-alpha-D-manno-heptose-7-phosphate kinase
MIVVRAPLRISFVGGGTDIPDFYTQHPGRVISVAIDKFVYIVLNRAPLVKTVSIRYATSETVSHPNELKHKIFKAALLDAGISSGIDIASFASIPSRTGMGSSSSFSVALMKALAIYQGKGMDRRGAAEAASRLEIELLQEPIGKQDQYAAAFGGFNVFQFNPDHSVDVRPVPIDKKNRFALEDSLSLFYTGIARDASSILGEQKSNINGRLEILRGMADSVREFQAKLLKADFRGCGHMLDEAWSRKKSLASTITNGATDAYYAAGMDAGAWGGKVLGAGGGGCIMFLSPAEKKETIRQAVAEIARQSGFEEFTEIPTRFTRSGVTVLHNSDQPEYTS